MWRSTEVPIHNIKSIERRHGPFGAGVLWIIYLRTGQSLVRVNVSNFHYQALKDFANALLQRDRGITFSGIRL